MPIDVGNGMILTPIELQDRDAIVKHMAAREIYENTLRIPYPYTAEHADQWLVYIAGTTQKNNGQPVIWAIRDAEAQLVGAIGLDDLVIGESYRSELGYWLAKPLWGKGIMPSVVQAVCQNAFANLGLLKISAHVFPGNPRSSRVLEKAGFEREGYLKQHFRKDGRLIDAVIYGLLKT